MGTRTVFQGGALVLVLFVMLGVVSFGALGMMSAYADLQLARKAAARGEEYYRLEGLAQEELCRAVGELSAGAYPDGWVLSGDILSRDLSYGGQRLHIELRAVEGGGGWELSAWRQWQENFEYEDEGIDIWIG